jgi:hypothetical protein
MEKKKLLIYIAAGLLLLGMIMSFTKVFNATMSYGGRSESEGGSMGDMKVTWAMVLIIIIDLIGIACLLLPTFGIMADKEALFFKVAMGAAALSFLLFLIAFFVGKGGDVGKAMDLVKAMGGKAGVHIGFTGWLVMIFHLGAGACAFLAGKEE